MITLIAIDPGDVYVGVAFFEGGDDGWECVDAQEFSPPEEFEDALIGTCLDGDSPDIIVYERYRLYEDKSNQQKGSEFRTSQCIGVIKFVVRVRNNHVEIHRQAEAEGKLTSCELQGKMCADPATKTKAIEIVGQLADIMKPTTGILRKKKIKSVAKPIDRAEYGGRGHVVAAELHGWHHILNTMKGKANV